SEDEGRRRPQDRDRLAQQRFADRHDPHAELGQQAQRGVRHADQPAGQVPEDDRRHRRQLSLEARQREDRTMATEQEIEATQKLSRELDAQVALLVQQVQDSSKSLAPVFEGVDKEIGRLVELTRRKEQPVGLTRECLDAALELMSDWTGMETEAIKGMNEAEGRKTP